MRFADIRDRLRASRSKGSARAVLMALFLFADDDGVCHPSITTLADLTGLYRSGVFLALDKLETLGEIARRDRGGGRVEAGRARTVTYVITIVANGPASGTVIDAEPSYGRDPTRPTRRTVNGPKCGAPTVPLAGPEGPMKSHTEGPSEESGAPPARTGHGTSPRGTRFTIAHVPDSWRAFCRERRPDLDPDRTFETFANYWRAKAGKDGVKLDWPATWRNWVLREGARRGSAQSGDRPSRGQEFARAALEVGELFAAKAKRDV